MSRTVGKPSDVLGSGKEVRINDDLGSAVVQELVAQHNQEENVISKTLSAGAGATAYAVLGRWKQDVWVKSISIGNTQTDDFVGANTDIFLRHCLPANADFVGTPVSPTTMFGLEGFNGDTFAGPNMLWDDEFVEGTNVTAKTGSAGVMIPAGNPFYVEFVNGEVGARSVEVTIVYSTVDRIVLEPRGMSDPYFQRNRARQRKSRQS